MRRTTANPVGSTHSQPGHTSQVVERWLLPVPARCALARLAERFAGARVAAPPFDHFLTGLKPAYECLKYKQVVAGALMSFYPKYTTTVIGAYSVPRWYEPLDRLVTLGQLLPEDMRDAQYRVMQGAIVDQEAAG